jgi:hypothetical protein
MSVSPLRRTAVAVWDREVRVARTMRTAKDRRNYLLSIAIGKRQTSGCSVLAWLIDIGATIPSPLLKTSSRRPSRISTTRAR